MKITDLMEAGAEPIYYLAYGMLTDPSLMQGAEKVGAAEVRHFEFELLQYANLLYKPGAMCYGALWMVSRDMIGHLDKVEGYPTMYDRKTIPVYVGGKKYVAEVYTFTPDYRQYFEHTKPDISYIRRLLRGYKHFGLPKEQIAKAYEIAKANYIEPEPTPLIYDV